MTATSVREQLALQHPLRVCTPLSLHAGSPGWTAVLDPPSHAARWRLALRALLPDWQLADPSHAEALAQAQVLLTWNPDPHLLAALPRLQFIQVLGASTEAVLHARLGAHVLVARACGANQVGQAVEYALAAVLHYHRGFDAYAAQQQCQCWQAQPIRIASERRVGVMGLGRLGSAVAIQLARLGFRVRGWASSAHQLPGVDTFHGQAGLEPFLRATEILVCLLPLTAHTRGLLGKPVFDMLPPAARLVHMGRFEQLVLADMLAALDDGRLAHATLDGLDTEQAIGMPGLARHPRIRLTPRAAGGLRPEIGAALVARNLHRWARQDVLEDLVDRARGY